MSRADDEAAITALVNRYSDAVNQRDWETYRNCWTEDAVWELGAPVNQKQVGIDAIMTEVKRAVGGMDLFVQMPHAITVLHMDGDSATARATLNEIGRIKPESKGLLHDADGMTILAIYTDILKREAGNWRFTIRTYEVLLFDGRAPAGEVVTKK